MPGLREQYVCVCVRACVCVLCVCCALYGLHWFACPAWLHIFFVSSYFVTFFIPVVCLKDTHISRDTYACSMSNIGQSGSQCMFNFKFYWWFISKPASVAQRILLLSSGVLWSYVRILLVSLCRTLRPRGCSVAGVGAFEYPKKIPEMASHWWPSGYSRHLIDIKMYCHDLEVMSSNPGWVRLWVHIVLLS